MTAIKQFTQDNLSIKNINFNRSGNFSYSIDTVRTWNGCRIDSKNELKFDIAMIEEAYGNKLIIETTIDLVKRDTDRLLDIYNRLKVEQGIIELLFDSSLIPLAYKTKNGIDLLWTALPECAERMRPLEFSTFHEAISSSNTFHSFPLLIGDTLLSISKKMPSIALIALILDYYADRAIPNTTQGEHSEITYEGLALMVRLLSLYANIPGITEVEIRNNFNKLKNKGFLPNVVHQFNTSRIEKLNTDRIEELFIGFLEKKAKNAQIQEIFENSQEKQYNTAIEIITSGNNKQFTVTKELEDQVILLDSLLNSEFDTNHITLLYNGEWAVVPNCLIRVTSEERGIVALHSYDMICGIVEDGNLSLVIKDKAINLQDAVFLEKVLEEHQEILTTIAFFNETSPGAREINKRYLELMHEI